MEYPWVLDLMELCYLDGMTADSDYVWLLALLADCQSPE